MNILSDFATFAMRTMDQFPLESAAFLFVLIVLLSAGSPAPTKRRCIMHGENRHGYDQDTFEALR